jgi:signal transduction histidine kinase
VSSKERRAREAFGNRLREIRLDAGLSGRQLADATGFHFTKVSRVEHGGQSLSDADIRAWCATCGADALVPDLIAQMRAVDTLYREWRRQTPSGLRRLQESDVPLYERTRLFRVHEHWTIPGLFQTAAYSTATMVYWRQLLDLPDDAEAATAARMERQRVLHEGDHRFAFLLAEQVLYTTIGSTQAMLEQLDRAFASQRQFIANASHELRTPLTVMRTAIDVVLAKPEPTREELMSMAADVRQAADHAERLIEALLVLARNDQARALTDPLDLAAVAEDALEGRTANGITTTARLDEAPVTGDGVLLERLVANLLDNAERYNIVGGTVAISTAAHDATSVLRVVNTGAVVPADMVEHLFLPFTRLDDRTRHDGFGLGLALVSSIAAVHGGTVHATAVPAGGLDITVRLPRRDNAVTPASPAT